jgi:hypothetical protein
MINDKGLVYDDAVSRFGTDTTVYSTSINHGVANANQGAGRDKIVRVDVNTAYTGGTSIKAIFQDSADDSSFATILEGPVVLIAAAIAGKNLLNATLPPIHRQYTRIGYVNVGANGAGKADSYLNITK